MPLFQRCLAVALRILPRRFRDRFGEELAAAALALADDARSTGGRRRRWRYIARELVAFTGLAIALARRGAGAGPRRGMRATLRDELGWALRYTRRRPVFALAVAVTLTASIAAATTAIGLARAVLWRQLPFDDASRLVFVWEESERDGVPQPTRVTSARYAAWRDQPGVFSALALFGATGFTLDSSDGSVSVRGVRVSAGYFETLGIRPALGRAFLPGDQRPGSPRVVILSSAFWQQRYGARRDIVGERVRLSGEPYTIVGVMPPVTFPAWPVNPAAVTLDPESRQLWVPIPLEAQLDPSGRAHVFGVVARLLPGVGPRAAIERLNLTADRSAPDPHRAHLVSLREQFVADTRTPLLALAGATLAVLLIACSNLAALYASAFESRRGELAIRSALGAGTGRLVRQLALEALVLVVAGTCGGLLIARAALAVLPGLLPPTLPFLTIPSVDLGVVAFAVGLAAIAVVMLAGWPIARLVGAALMPRGVAARPRGLVYRALVVAQVAVTVALAVAGGLLGQSLTTVNRQHPGFAVERVLVAAVALPGATPGDAGSVTTAEQRMLAAIAALPNVEAVAAAYDHPLEANWSEAPVVLGHTGTSAEPRQVELRIVSPGYFEALDVELLDGRTLTERDALDAPGAAVVNEAFAREVGGRVVGRRLRSGTPRFNYERAPEEFAIVGVVSNERFRGLEQPASPAYYLSTRQFPQTSLTILARTLGDPVAAAPDVRAAIRAADPSTTVERPTSLEEILADQLVARRVTTDLIGGFAAAAVGLAALGMYGLLAGLVSSRRRELGVRLAVGASPGSVARLVVGDSLRNAGIGVALGAALSLATGRLIQGLLVDVSPHDPVTLAVVVLALLTVAVMAAVLPARRAARIDPVDALRADG